MAEVNIYIENINIYINPPKDEPPVVINEWPEPPYDFPEEAAEAEVELYDPTKEDEFKVGDEVIYVGDDVDYKGKELFLAGATVVETETYGCSLGGYIIEFDLDENVSCWGSNNNRWSVDGADLVKAH